MDYDFEIEVITDPRHDDGRTCERFVANKTIEGRLFKISDLPYNARLFTKEMLGQCHQIAKKAFERSERRVFGEVID